MVRPQGFEPRYTESESVVLPLHHGRVDGRRFYSSTRKNAKVKAVFDNGPASPYYARSAFFLLRKDAYGLIV